MTVICSFDSERNLRRGQNAKCEGATYRRTLLRLGDAGGERRQDLLL